MEVPSGPFAVTWRKLTSVSICCNGSVDQTDYPLGEFAPTAGSIGVRPVAVSPLVKVPPLLRAVNGAKVPASFPPAHSWMTYPVRSASAGGLPESFQETLRVEPAAKEVPAAGCTNCTSARIDEVRAARR